MALCVAQETYKVHGEHQYALQLGSMYKHIITYMIGFPKTNYVVKPILFKAMIKKI